MKETSEHFYLAHIYAQNAETLNGTVDPWAFLDISSLMMHLPFFCCWTKCKIFLHCYLESWIKIEALLTVHQEDELRSSRIIITQPVTPAHFPLCPLQWLSSVDKVGKWVHKLSPRFLFNAGKVFALKCLQSRSRGKVTHSTWHLSRRFFHDCADSNLISLLPFR